MHPRDPSRRDGRVDPTRCAHFYRKGYYLGSDADFCCMLCGHEASSEEVAPPSSEARPE